MPTDVPIEIDCASVKARLDRGDDFLLLDCREREEYETARIAGATLVPMSELMIRVGELQAAQSKPVVVHCHHGGRSLKVTHWLRQNGFPQAQNMTGGIDRWSQEIDPAVPRY
ncbi:MAG TPA: rhodanese-like domain-containing protein [Pirellulales bacterium]|jgi:rhodanese-related sulfurtransferase|nr:rhodanese-like domain-containing protein [Pirellulales bacterium]